jgi:glycosyltransferase involved in cell wall biosynthesis
MSNPRKTRIAMVVHGMAGGGLERAVRDLTLQVHQRGFEPAVFSTAHLGLYFEELSQRGVAVFDCRTEGARLPGLSLPLHRSLKAFRPDIIHSHSGTILPSSISRLILRRPRMVFTDHGRYPEPGWVARVERLCLTQIDRYVAVADELGDHVKHYLHMKARPSIIANGIDLSPYRRPPLTSRATLRAEWGIGPEDVLVMSVGRLMVVKNHSLLLNALALSARDFPGLKAAMVGDGVLEEQLRAEAQTLGVADRVKWLGFRKDVSDCLRAADLFVISSDSEGLPLVLLEAMAAGLPVVSTHVGGIPRVLGEGGVTAPIQDPSALAVALTRVAGDPSLRGRMGRVSLERSAAFSVETMAESYLRVYREVLGENSPAEAPPVSAGSEAR